ncbi:MAG: hypothetical protein K6G00_05340 [Treponema sp.]|nr:hypothetical protein [Treponema sp.]
MDIYKASVKELLAHLAKRALVLAAKLLGFKAFCLFLTTVLLRQGIVDKEAWLTVIITVLCSASGVHIADRLGTGGKGIINSKITGVKNDGSKKDSYAAPDGSSPIYSRCSGISGKAKEEARRKIRELCRRAASQLEKAGS